MNIRKIFNIIVINIALMASKIFSSESYIKESCDPLIPTLSHKYGEELIYHETINYSFRCQLEDLRLNPYPSIEQKKIVILNGTSSSGKTSLSKSIKELNSQLILLDHDTAFEKILYKLLCSRLKANKQEKYIIKGLMDALFFTENHPLRNREIKKFHSSYKFYDKIKELDLLFSLYSEDVSNNTVMYLKEKVRFFNSIGRKVILDVSVLNKKKFKYFVDCFDNTKPEYYLIYCSPLQLIKNISKRNLEAINYVNKSAEWRYADYVLTQYVNLFCETEDVTSKKIESFEKSDFKINLKEVLEWPLTFLSLDQQEYESLYKLLLAKLKSIKARKDNLYVSNRYSKVLNTSQITSMQGAKIVLKWISEKN